MNARSILTGVGGLLLAAAAYGARAQTAEDAPPQVQEPTPEDTQQTSVAAEMPESTRSILRRSAAIVQATVERITYAYDERTGPRTVVTLAISKVLAGGFGERSVELRLFGGPTPDGSFFSTSESIHFVENAVYVLFLRNDSWFFMPTVGTALRVEEVEGRQLLTDTHGHPLRGLSPRGMTFGEDRVPLAGTAEPRVRQQGAEEAESTGSPAARAGALDVERLSALLGEAMRAEGVAPYGRFTSAPLQRDNWRNTPVTPARSVTDAPASKSDVLRKQEER